MIFRFAPLECLAAVAVFTTAAIASRPTTTSHTSIPRRSTVHHTLTTKFRAVVTDIATSTDSTSTRKWTSSANNNNISMTNATQTKNTTVPLSISSRWSSSISKMSTSTSSSTSSGSSDLAYAPLPGLCVPGTLFCSSSQSFSQCVATSDKTRAYINMGAVAGGMQCITHFSTASDGSQYQDDEIVRSAPWGYCRGQDGSYKCLRGGNGFAVCDGGIWVDMGAVALGTTCEGAPRMANIVVSN